MTRITIAWMRCVLRQVATRDTAPVTPTIDRIAVENRPPAQVLRGNGGLRPS
jgi:hypothetical protein